MTNLPPADSSSEGPGLIEPVQPPPTVEIDQVDTERILRDTGTLDFPRSSESSDSEETDEAPAGRGSLGEEKEYPPQSGLNVLSLISLVLALTLSPFAVVFGYVAVGQVRRSRQRGEALAWVSVGLGWLWAILYVVLGIALGTTLLQL